MSKWEFWRQNLEDRMKTMTCSYSKFWVLSSALL
jgi:hypothetical protein